MSCYKSSKACVERIRRSVTKNPPISEIQPMPQSRMQNQQSYLKMLLSCYK